MSRFIAMPHSARAAIETLFLVPEIDRVILFGSRAVGDHEDRSDFDIAISAPDIDKGRLAALRDALGRSRTLCTISLSSLDFMPQDLKDRVLAQGTTLYEREKAG